MKKSLFILVLLFVPIICSAQILEKSTSGKYRVSNEKWKSLGITVKPEAQKYNSLFSRAIASPDKKITVKSSTTFLRLKPVFKRIIEVEKTFIIYNSSTKQISCIESKQQKEETTYLILFCALSLILMVISDVLYKKSRLALIVAVVAVVAFVASFSALSIALVVTNTIPINAPFIAAVVFAAFAAAAIHVKDDKFYKILSIIFYIAMVVGMVMLFV